MISQVVPRSPIVKDLKRIYFDSIVELAPSFTHQRWKDLGFVDSEADKFHKLVNFYVEEDRFDQIYTLAQSKSTILVSLLQKYLLKKDHETFKRISVKLVEYLRHKPNRFRVLLENINGSTLPILFSCSYEWHDLLQCLRGERNGKLVMAVLMSAVKSTIFQDYDYLGNQPSYYQQLASILHVVIENTPELTLIENSEIERLQVLMKVRYNQPVDLSLLQSIPVWGIDACAVLAKNYQLALSFMQSLPGSNFEIIMSDPEFCKLWAKSRPSE